LFFNLNVTTFYFLIGHPELAWWSFSWQKHT